MKVAGILAVALAGLALSGCIYRESRSGGRGHKHHEPSRTTIEIGRSGHRPAHLPGAGSAPAVPDRTPASAARA